MEKSSSLLLLLWFSTFCANVGMAAPQYDGFNITNATVGSTSANTNRVTNYTCTLSSLWTSSRQPSSYPSNPSFLNPILVAHSSGYTLWGPGKIASKGLNSLVQTGSTDPVINEINNAGEELVLGYKQGTTQNVLLLQKQILPSIQIDKAHSYLTTVVPFSPSPDWFNGFYAFNTIDSGTNTFYDSFTIQVFAWDLGSETGDTYQTAGTTNNPFQPIFEYTLGSIPSSNIFLDSTRQQVLPVASWTCDLQVGEVDQLKPKTSAAPTIVMAVAVHFGLIVAAVALAGLL